VLFALHELGRQPEAARATSPARGGGVAEAAG
jgi:hypothetical protein